MKKFTDDPHLFTYTLNEGVFKAKEIFNFTQDDLTTEDVLILDCYEEIFVWIGRHSSVKSKQSALSIGQEKFAWSPEATELVHGVWLKTAAKRYRGTLCLARKQKIGMNLLNPLQTDTASVLQEASTYIKLLQGQVQNLYKLFKKIDALMKALSVHID